MGTTSITIQIDTTLKEQAEKLFENMGMNMTTAFTIFTKTAVRKGRLPFEIEADPFYSEANQARLRAGIAAFESGIGISEHELIEVDDEENLV
jgi:DNA-damage-inducible protein J